MPAPKLFRSFPDESNFMIGATVEPAQLSYVYGDSPGGMSGFAPHRLATQTDSPSLSIATAFSAPQVLPSGSSPHGAIVWYGLGRSFVGWGSPSPYALARYNVIAATITTRNINPSLPCMSLLLEKSAPFCDVRFFVSKRTATIPRTGTPLMDCTNSINAVPTA